MSKTVTCPCCGKAFQSQKKYCSKECAIEGAKRTRRATLMQKYGVENVAQLPVVVNKRAQTVTERYGVPYAVFLNPHKKQTSELQIVANKLPSELTRELSDAVLLKVLTLLNVKVVPQYSLGDCVYSAYIPSKQIVVSVDTTVNSNAFRHTDPWYHRHMSEVARQHGLRCIHIFDWDNIEKIYMMLLPKIHIYARSCTISEINKNDTSMFLNMFHLQNSCNAQICRYGLYYEHQLVMIMTFGKSRFSKKFDWELLRLCTDPDYQVVGGASKLFRHFLRMHQPKSVISYCDISKFDGRVYEAIGMKLYQDVSPNRVWSRGSEKITDRLLCTAGYDRLFNTSYGKGTRNEQLMIDNNWLPVYDCGQLSFKWSAESEELI